MKQLILAAFATLATLAGTTAVAGGNFGPPWFDVHAFAYLPDGVRYPEGITADPATGNIYVGTFDFGPNANKLLRYSKDGVLIATKDFGATPLLGLGFADGKVYALAFGAGQVLRLPANFDASTPAEVFANVPTVGAPGPRSVTNPDTSTDTIAFGFSGGAKAPNAMVFDRWGNLYFSDSFQGAIFRVIGATGCTALPCPVALVSHDPLLATAGFPPFGANGLAIDPGATTLYVANTGDNRVLKLNLATNEVSVFAESVHGADGLLLDDAGRLWVAANQADELVALDARGRVVMRAGEFDGIRSNGTPRGLLFPASMVISNGFMYVTNLALPLTPAVGDEPEEDVTRWSIARFRVPRPH
jgi:DNA-binding beta-propeller fold protein YncE